MSFAAFMAMTGAQPWAWGVQDCTLWVADWCKLRWRVDPALSFRDRYDSEAGAQSLIDRAGSLIGLVSPHMAFLVQKNEADEGDVGVIEVLGRQTAAIRVGDKWAFRSPAGVGFVDAAPLIVWGD